MRVVCRHPDWSLSRKLCLFNKQLLVSETMTELTCKILAWMNLLRNCSNHTKIVSVRVIVDESKMTYFNFANARSRTTILFHRTFDCPINRFEQVHTVYPVMDVQYLLYQQWYYGKNERFSYAHTNTPIVR